jgi:hypothetical protein
MEKLIWNGDNEDDLREFVGNDDYVGWIIMEDGACIIAYGEQDDSTIIIHPSDCVIKTGGRYKVCTEQEEEI